MNEDGDKMGWRIGKKLFFSQANGFESFKKRTHQEKYQNQSKDGAAMDIYLMKILFADPLPKSYA